MQAEDEYRIVLVPRNEGVEYADNHGVYGFLVKCQSKEWTVMLPGMRRDIAAARSTTAGKFEPHELSADEEARILPRVSKYLSRVKWFGIFPRSYSVRFVRRQYAGHDMIGTFYSSMGNRRAVITREAAGDYRVCLERRDHSAPAVRGMPSWTAGQQRVANTMDHAKALAKELLDAASDDRSSDGGGKGTR
jgi:hypothetical protein